MHSFKVLLQAAKNKLKGLPSRGAGIIEKHELESIACDLRINHIYMPHGLDGLYMDDEIFISKHLHHTEYLQVLAEEIGHHYTSYGNITDYSHIPSAKQENKARRFGYELLVTLEGLVNAFKAYIRSPHELADYFNITVDYLERSIEHYKQKYGLSTFYNGYLIRFEPLHVYEYKTI